MTGGNPLQPTSGPTAVGDSSTLPSIGSSHGQGAQAWSVERGKLELKAESDAHKHRLVETELRHKLEQEKKDNDIKRGAVIVISIILVATLLLTLVVGFVNDDPNTRQWGQGISTTLIGGLIGAIAGYFTGRSGN